MIDVIQLPCPLWLGIGRLDEALSAACRRLGSVDRHAATMTGAPADTFADRGEGVTVIAERLARAVAPAPLQIYAGRSGFLDPGVAAIHTGDIASANWHASAALAARFVSDALFVDIGSTTTDLAPIAGGRVQALGYNDAERLACGELVYTGLTRSFLMSLCRTAPWPAPGRRSPASISLPARMFIVSSGNCRSTPTSCRPQMAEARPSRLRRLGWPAWWGRTQQTGPTGSGAISPPGSLRRTLRLIADGAMLVLSRARLPDAAPAIGAGIGRHLAARLASRLGRRFTDFADLIEASSAAREWLGHCAPAVSVALLAPS